MTMSEDWEALARQKFGGAAVAEEPASDDWEALAAKKFGTVAPIPSQPVPSAPMFPPATVPSPERQAELRAAAAPQGSLSISGQVAPAAGVEAGTMPGGPSIIRPQPPANPEASIPGIG